MLHADDRPADITKLTVAFRNFANAPQNTERNNSRRSEALVIIVHAKIAMTVAGKVSLIRLDFSRSMRHCRQLNSIKQAKGTKRRSHYKKLANDARRHAVYTVHQGIIYFQNCVRSHGTCVNAMTKASPKYPLSFHRNMKVLPQITPDTSLRIPSQSLYTNHRSIWRYMSR